MWNEYDIISQQGFLLFHQKKALRLRQFDIFQPEAIHQTLSDGLKTYILSLPSKVSLPRPFSIEITTEQKHHFQEKMQSQNIFERGKQSKKVNNWVVKVALEIFYLRRFRFLGQRIARWRNLWLLEQKFGQKSFVENRNLVFVQSNEHFPGPFVVKKSI